jgi:hypothetical protein
MYSVYPALRPTASIPYQLLLLPFCFAQIGQMLILRLPLLFVQLQPNLSIRLLGASITRLSKEGN